MRFLEWVQDHPQGVVSLPTGKTPEHFIRWVEHLLPIGTPRRRNRSLARSGVDPRRFPDMRSLHFVQIDEFYPIDPAQQNSFYHYVNKFLLEGFGLDREQGDADRLHEDRPRAGQTLESVWPDYRVDLSLRTRAGVEPAGTPQQGRARSGSTSGARSTRTAIRALGGIGFFLGGIGPDGQSGSTSAARTITRPRA